MKKNKQKNYMNKTEYLISQCYVVTSLLVRIES